MSRFTPINGILLFPLPPATLEIVCDSASQLLSTGVCNQAATIREAESFAPPVSEPGKHRVQNHGMSARNHGWHDWNIGVTDRDGGVPDAVKDLVFTFNYNDLDSIADAIYDDVACVILEPVTFEPPREGFLQGLRDLCTERGVVLVFDEMWKLFLREPLVNKKQKDCIKTKKQPDR